MMKNVIRILVTDEKPIDNCIGGFTVKTFSGENVAPKADKFVTKHNLTVLDYKYFGNENIVWHCLGDLTQFGYYPI